VFICVKNYIDCRELWTDEDFEMVAIEVKGRDPKFTWEIVGIYRAPNDDMRVMEILAVRTDYAGNSTKRSIIERGGDLNLLYADWNGNAGCNSGTRAFINSLVWENGFTQVVDSPTRGDALLDVYLVRPESSFTASSIVKGISDHHGIILAVEWEENCCIPQVEKLVPVYHETDVFGLQNLLRKNKEYGQAMVVAWRRYGITSRNSIRVYRTFFPHKILRKNPDPECYSKEVKRLKIKARKAYNRRKLGEHHLEELKRLFKQLLAAKKLHKRRFSDQY